jgi:hypothetical protein
MAKDQKEKAEMLDEKLKSMTVQPREEKKREEAQATIGEFTIKEHVESLADKEIIAKNNLDLDEDDLPPPLL